LTTTAATSLFYTTPLTNNTLSCHTTDAQATTQSTTQDTTQDTAAAARGASPFAALPWAKLANAGNDTVGVDVNVNDNDAPGKHHLDHVLKHDPNAGTEPATWPLNFGSAHNDELYAMLTGTYGGDGGDGGGDTPVLLPSMSPLASKALDFLAAASPGTALLNLLQQDGAAAGPTPLDLASTAGAPAGQVGDSDLLSPSLDRLIKQLRDDSGDGGGHGHQQGHPHQHGHPLQHVAAATPLKAGKPARKRKNTHDPRGPAWHALDDKLRHIFTPEQLHLPTPEFRALLVQMSLTPEEDKRVKQLRRRNKCVEYSRANRRKNRLKKAGAAAEGGTHAPPPPKDGNLAVENVRLHEQLAALQQRIDNIYHTI